MRAPCPSRAYAPGSRALPVSAPIAVERRRGATYYARSAPAALARRDLGSAGTLPCRGACPEGRARSVRRPSVSPAKPARRRARRPPREEPEAEAGEAARRRARASVPASEVFPPKRRRHTAQVRSQGLASVQDHARPPRPRSARPGPVARLPEAATRAARNRVVSRQRGGRGMDYVSALIVPYVVTVAFTALHIVTMLV